MINIHRITVLKGGWSPEREISLQSGSYIANLLRKDGFNVYEIDVKKDLMYLTEELYKSNPDYIYNALHGIGGEDGLIQGILEVFGKPYSNSSVLSSAICFNKQICKTIVKASGVNTIEGYCINASDIKNINNNFTNTTTVHNDISNTNDINHKINTDINSNIINIEYPFVIKPSCNGSSIGIFLIFNENDLKKVKVMDWHYGNEVIIEKYISGREFTVAVSNGKTIGALEILSINKFYDFEAKYSEGGSKHMIDYILDKSTENYMFRMAERAYKACNCKGIARIDFRYNGKDVYFLEINTQPGMTATSLVPDILRNNNISFINTLNNDSI